MERGCKQNDSLTDGQADCTEVNEPYEGCIDLDCTDVDTPYAGCSPPGPCGAVDPDFDPTLRLETMSFVEEARCGRAEQNESCTHRICEAGYGGGSISCGLSDAADVIFTTGVCTLARMLLPSL